MERGAADLRVGAATGEAAPDSAQSRGWEARRQGRGPAAGTRVHASPRLGPPPETLDSTQHPEPRTSKETRQKAAPTSKGPGELYTAGRDPSDGDQTGAHRGPGPTRRPSQALGQARASVLTCHGPGLP